MFDRSRSVCQVLLRPKEEEEDNLDYTLPLANTVESASLMKYQTAPYTAKNPKIQRFKEHYYAVAENKLSLKVAQTDDEIDRLAKPSNKCFISIFWTNTKFCFTEFDCLIFFNIVKPRN